MIEIITFRKKPILKISDDNNNQIKIQFGIKKAKLLSGNFEAIEKFIEENDNPAPAKSSLTCDSGLEGDIAINAQGND